MELYEKIRNIREQKEIKQKDMVKFNNLLLTNTLLYIIFLEVIKWNYTKKLEISVNIKK